MKQSCNESMLAGSKVLDFVDISKKQLKKRFAVAARRVRVCVSVRLAPVLERFWSQQAESTSQHKLKFIESL